MIKSVIFGAVLTSSLITVPVSAANFNVLVDNVGANNLTVMLPPGNLVLVEGCPGGTMQDANGNTVCTAATDKVPSNFSDVVEFKTIAGVNNGNTVATLSSDVESTFPALPQQTVYILEDGTLGFPGGANTGYTRFVFVTGGNTYNIYTNSDSPTNEGTEVPEPSTLLLFGTGFVGLLGYGWRRKAVLSAKYLNV